MPPCKDRDRPLRARHRVDEDHNKRLMTIQVLFGGAWQPQSPCGEPNYTELFPTDDHHRDALGDEPTTLCGECLLRSSLTWRMRLAVSALDETSGRETTPQP